MACTCLSQQHTSLWDVFFKAYQVLFSAGAAVCLIQAPNPGKSGPNMPSKSFHYLSQKLQTLNFSFSFFPLSSGFFLQQQPHDFYSISVDKLLGLNVRHTQKQMQKKLKKLKRDEREPEHSTVCHQPDLDLFSWELWGAVETQTTQIAPIIWDFFFFTQANKFLEMSVEKWISPDKTASVQFYGALVDLCTSIGWSGRSKNNAVCRIIKNI